VKTTSGVRSAIQNETETFQNERKLCRGCPTAGRNAWRVACVGGDDASTASDVFRELVNEAAILTARAVVPPVFAALATAEREQGLSVKHPIRRSGASPHGLAGVIGSCDSSVQPQSYLLSR
jgi:hypothetical protein